MHEPCAAVRSQSRVSSGAGAVFVPEDAQHKLEQGTELGQQSIAPTASHAWGTPTQQELLVLFSLLSVIRTGCSVPFLHSFPSPPAPRCLSWVHLFPGSLPCVLGREGAGAGWLRVGAGAGGAQGLLPPAASPSPGGTWGTNPLLPLTVPNSLTMAQVQVLPFWGHFLLRVTSLQRNIPWEGSFEAFNCQIFT